MIVNNKLGLQLGVGEARSRRVCTMNLRSKDNCITVGISESQVNNAQGNKLPCSHFKADEESVVIMVNV